MAGLKWGAVKYWRAEELGKAADNLGRSADALEESRDKIKWETRTSSWLGRPTVRAAGRRYRLVTLMDKHVDGKRQVQKALYHAADQVEEIERLVEEVEAQARFHDFVISDDGEPIDNRPRPQFFDTQSEEDAWDRDRKKVKEEIGTQLGSIVSKARVADATLTDSIPPGYVPDVDKWGTPSGEVTVLWEKLSDPQRQAIIKQLNEELAENYGIDPGTIELDPEQLDDPGVLGTVATDVRSAYQEEVVRDADVLTFWWEDDPFKKHEENGITPEQAEEWKKDFDNDEPRGEDYWEQPSVKDALGAGREYVDGLTPDELNRLLKKANLSDLGTLPGEPGGDHLGTLPGEPGEPSGDHLGTVLGELGSPLEVK